MKAEDIKEKIAFEDVEIDIILFGTDDVIATSGPTSPWDY